MFERFTERARQAVVLAQDEAARALRHDYIGTEHLLLGLLREEQGVAARVLESLGITLDAVRDRIVGIVGQGDGVRGGLMPFTPRAKNVLELSLREALSLGHNYIGTEHILLALVRAEEGVAARVLQDLGASARTIRSEVLGSLVDRVVSPDDATSVSADDDVGVRSVSDPPEWRQYTPSAPARPPHPAETLDRTLRRRPGVATAGLALAGGTALGLLLGRLIWG